MPTEPPLGAKLDWTPVQRPTRAPLLGSHVLLRPVDPAADAGPLYEVSHPPDGDPAIWTYLPDGPYDGPPHLRQMLNWAQTSEDPLYFTLMKAARRAPARGCLLPAHHARVRRHRDR